MGFLFALSDPEYQLGTLGGFCSSTFTIEINGNHRFYRYGSDADECQPGWDLESIKAAFVESGDTLRIYGGNNWRWTFDHARKRNTEVIFDGFGAGNVSSTSGVLTTDDVQIQANYLKLTRPTLGSGTIDQGNGNNCVYYGGDGAGRGLDGLAPQLVAGQPVGDEGRLKVFSVM